MEPNCVISRVSSISAKPYLVFNKVALGELLTLHRKDRIWLLATRSHWFVSLMFPHTDFKIRYWGKKNKNKRTNLDTEYNIAKTLRIFPIPAALFSDEASRQHLSPSKEARPAAGRSITICVKKGDWRAGPGKCLILPWHTAWAVQLLLRVCWSTAVTASSYPFTGKWKKGAGSESLLHTALLAALWPPLLLGCWQYFHVQCFILMRKRGFGSASE